MVFYAFICFGAALISLIVAADPHRPGIYLLLGFIAFITALVLFALAKPGIKAVRQENGARFWLKGFKPAFFDQLRVMYSKPG